MARILLIDDDDSFRTILGLALEQSGHTVLEAHDGEEGLKLFPHAKADLVITDLVMPGKEGFEVLMALRKKQPPVKIIVVSGGLRDGATDFLQMARFLGAGRALAKPFALEALLTAITELLAGTGTIPGEGNRPRMGSATPPATRFETSHHRIPAP